MYWKKIIPKSQSHLQRKEEPESYFLSQVSFQVANFSMYVETAVRKRGESLKSPCPSLSKPFGEKTLPVFESPSKFASLN